MLAKLKLSVLDPTAVLVLSILLTAAEGVQLNITMSGQAHAVLTVAISVLVGAGIPAISKESFLNYLPPHVATLIASVVGGLLVLVHTFNIASPWPTVIAVVVVALEALGIGPITSDA